MADVKKLYFADTSKGFEVVGVEVFTFGESNKYFSVDKPPYINQLQLTSSIGVKFFLSARECAEHALKQATAREIAAHREAEAIEAWMVKNGAEDESHKRRNHPNEAVRAQYGMTDGNGHWTGKVETLPQNLDKPLHVKKPQVWTVWNDLFHENVPFYFIEQTWNIIKATPQHTYLLLTKRPDRMNHFFSTKDIIGEMRYPVLPNVWLGTTVESPDYLYRIGDLLSIPAAKYFISVEPMLAGINLFLHQAVCFCDGEISAEPEWEKHGRECPKCGKERPINKLDLVICGCESGTHRRPFDEQWARDLKDQCVAADVPFFMKQMVVNGKVTKKVEEFPADLQIRNKPYAI